MKTRTPKQSTAKPSAKSKPKPAATAPAPLSLEALGSPKHLQRTNAQSQNTKTRIRLYTKNGGAEIRELLRIWQNEHNDVMLDMDGGQTVQFTPHQQRPYTMPSINDVAGVAQGVPRMSILQMTQGASIPPIWGDFRLVATMPPASGSLRDGEQFGVYTVTEAGKRVAVASKDGKPRVYIVTGRKLWDALAVLLPAVEGNQFIDMKAKNHDGFYRLFKNNKRIGGLNCGAIQFKNDCLECRPDAHGGNSAPGSWWRLRAKPEI